MKKYLFLYLFIIVFISCKSNILNDVVIEKNINKYKIFFQDTKKDTVIINFPYSFIITNKSRSILNFHTKSKPDCYLSGDFTINKKGELDVLINQKIRPCESVVYIFFISKLYKKDEMKKFLPFENFKTYSENFSKIDDNKQKLQLDNSIKQFLNEMEKDTISFEFTNSDKGIYFYKVGTIEGKTFFTDDKSKK